MKQYNYDLTFADMIKEIFKTNGWYQGEEFGDGVYIQAFNGEIRTKVFSNQWLGAKNIGGFMVTYGVTKMKYRRVYTQPDVMRKV